MHEINLRSVDLNLLTVFEAVYQERSQIRSAERLGMTQPAISHAMSRLRHLIKDPLFLAKGRSLIPTPRADTLYLRIHESLGLIRLELRNRLDFIPEESIRTFVISISHGGGYLLGPILTRKIHQFAPHARIVIRLIDPEEEIPRLLREHRVDIAYHHRRLDDSMLEHLPVGGNEIALVVSEDHPRIQSPPTREQLMGERFIMVHEPMIQSDHTELMEFIGSLNVAIEITSAGQIPNYVESSDLIGITVRSLADAFKQRYRIRSYSLPIPTDAYPVYMIWHRSKNDDPAHQWLRDISIDMLENLSESHR